MTPSALHPPPILTTALSLTALIAFSQNPERILNKNSSNLKEPSNEAIELYNKGVDHFNKHEYPQAIRSYKQAIALDSDYIDAYNNIGLTFFESSQLDSAAYYLQISLYKLPTGTTALQNMGLVAEQKGDQPQALKYYQQITALEPQNPEGYYNCARALAAMARLDESLAQAQQAEKLYAKAGSPQLSDCHLMLLIIYYNMHNKPMYQKYKALCKKEGVQIPAEVANDPN